VPTGTTTHLALSLDAVPSSVREARNAAADAVADVGLPAQAVDDVRLCVSEAVANVVRHAYAASGAIRLVVESRRDELVVSVRDSGAGFVRDASRAAEERVGGFGLTIIERLADRMDLRSEPGVGTSIVMIFLLPRDGVREIEP